jgi:hypothetical protein
VGTHYETLGVGRGATGDEVRRAYLERARALHPDRTGHAGGSASPRAMQDVNEAWRVLRDPGQRAAYDRALDARAAPAPPGPRPAPEPDDLDRPYPGRPVEPGDVGMSLVRGLPWLVVLALLGLIFVFTAFAGGGGGTADRIRPSDLVGGCVQGQRGGAVMAVPCSGPNEGRVDLVVDRASRCPSGTSAVPMQAHDAWLCLRPATSP